MGLILTDVAAATLVYLNKLRKWAQVRHMFIQALNNRLRLA